MLRSMLGRVARKVKERAAAPDGRVERRRGPVPARSPAPPARAAAPAASPPRAAPLAPAASPPPPAADPPAPREEAPAPDRPASSFSALAASVVVEKEASIEDIGLAADEGTDLEAYRRRLKANGREHWVLHGEGLQVAGDGVPFIGPLDNESSRAAAAGKVLTIDQDECITCGTCEENSATVFHLPDDEKARVLRQRGPMDLIQDAIDQCPVTCINWIDPDELQEQHSAGGYEPDRG